MVVLSLGGGLFAYTWIHLEVLRTGYRIDKLERELRELNRKERQLRLEAAYLASPSAGRAPRRPGAGHAAARAGAGGVLGGAAVKLRMPRLRIAAVIGALWIAAIAGRLYYLQVAATTTTRRRPRGSSSG